ncbi:MAG: transketolase [Anaerolineales bacterium]|nr:transketolase [Anaerolineales bacterium]
MSENGLQTRAINTIRFLSADAVEEANSGHPGTPMALAPIAYLLWTKHLKYNPQDPAWPDRDRFILSAGHASMLLYSILHLTGYDLPLKELKNFRQLGSITPGHPENHLTPGVEVTTGPLGQGFANGVGMAIATEHLAAIYNKPDFPIVDHWIYAICSDGDLMEGISSEAASLAGHQKLGRLIYFFDDNHITIDGDTDLAFTEDQAARFEAYNWHVQKVDDVNDLDALDKAIENAKVDKRPSLIVVRSTIGIGMPTKAGTAAAHGEPPGEEELNGAKANLGWPIEPRFLIPDDVRKHFREAGAASGQRQSEWQDLFDEYAETYPDLAAQFVRTFAGELPEGLERNLPDFEPDTRGMATRASSGKVLNAIAAHIPELMGGSADLTGSNKTDIKGEPAFSVDNRAARYIHYGVREHGMAGIMNGIAAHGGLIPYGGTFMIFSDYLKPSARLSALMGKSVIYVLTHDSIGLGEDGPTHQPIEQLAGLRAIPNFTVIRPADANEVAYAWLAALQNREGPTALVLTRQAVPTLDRNEFAPAEESLKGAYVLVELGDGDPQVILMASGSEVGLIMQAGKALAADGIANRLVSFPSWELFKAQTISYQEQVFPKEIRARVAVEAGVTQGWDRWVGDGGRIIGLDRFGESAPYEEVYEHLGITVDAVVNAAKEALRALR